MKSVILTRRDFLHAILHPLSVGSGAARDREDLSAPDYYAMLPSDFSEFILKKETAALGGDPDAMTKNAMAELVLRHMQKS